MVIDGLKYTLLNVKAQILLFFSQALTYALLERMNGAQHLKIESEPFMPLTI